uniref:Uncharacterized protein n=1 Tax=Salix viminalis TaxID=40686 RepID=A0A6N2MTI3_SALVM
MNFKIYGKRKHNAKRMEDKEESLWLSFKNLNAIVAACAVGVEVGGFGCCWRRQRKRAVAGGGSAIGMLGKDWLSWV